MFAAGCLLLIVLPLAGLAIGSFAGAAQGAIWGAIIGLIVAIAACAVPIYALVKARRG